MQVKRRKWILYGTFIFLLILFYFWNPLSNLRFLLEDLLYQHTSEPSTIIRVIGIDDKSLEVLGPWNSWPRTNIADIIDILNADPDNRPAVIGVNVVFLGETSDDQALVHSVSRSDNVVLASQLQFLTSLQRAETGYYKLNPLSIEGISLPPKPLNHLIQNGFSNIFLDSDGLVRRSMLTAEVNGSSYDSFPYAVYQKYCSALSLPAGSIKTDSNGLWTIPYTAPTGSYQRGISFIDVLNGTVPASEFKDSIVLIGATAYGMLESYSTPVSRNMPMSDTEINANLIQAIMESKVLTQVPSLIQVPVLFLLLTGCFFLYHHEKLAVRIVCLFISTLGWLSFTAFCSRIGYLWDALYFPVFSLFLCSIKTVVDYLSEHNQRLLTLETFERYVSPEVARHLLSNHITSVQSIGESKRHIAVLFIDIRGFTPLSESLEPEAVADILNNYLTLAATAVLDQGGTIDKFIGDAMMAIFNAPGDLDDYVYRAVQTALTIMDGKNSLNDSLYKAYGIKINFGIGIHCGDAMVGSIGAPFRMEYTAIGDTVNVASRLESIAAPDQILISRDICKALESRIKTDYLGTKKLKGKEDPFPIYQASSLL